MSALDLLPEAVLIARPDGRIVFRNAQAARTLPPGGQLSSVMVSQELAGLDWTADLLAAREGTIVRRNVTLSGVGGRRLLVDVHLRRLTAEAPGPGTRAGSDEAVLVVVEDASLRASAERRLAASERLAAQAKAAARMGHELNNPLDGVLRYIGLAQRVAAGEVAEHLSAARDGLLRIAGIIRGMLSGQTGLGQRETLGSLLGEAVSAFAPRADALGVVVACELEQGADAPADGRLFQVFCNIIKNALDAMPDGGRLAIRARAEGGRRVIEFTDTGCGLTAEQAQRAFEPFYTTKPAGQGLGLGLTICREIVSALGGTIALAPGQRGGAAVTVTLPWPQGSGQENRG